jgi:hypothetical protein
LETQLQSQILERAEPVVGAIAASGLRRWRVEPINIEPLFALSLVQAELAAIGTGSETDVDARRDAVDAAIRAAIKRLPEPFYAAAQAHFGADDEGEKPLGKGDREEAAAAVLGRSGRWYVQVGRSTKYLDKTPSEYVVALVTCALGGIADPTSHLAQRALSEPSADGEVATQAEALAVRRRLLPRRMSSVRRSTALTASGLLATLLGVAIVGLAVGWWGEGSAPRRSSKRSSQESHEAAPALHVNPDAPCASFSTDIHNRRPPTEFVSSPGQLQGGEGGLAAKITPNGKYSQLLTVSTGDIVELSIKLHDVDYQSVYDVVVQVTATHEPPRCTRLFALARSTTSPRDRAEQGPVILKSISGPPPRVRYIPGSTVFLAQSGRRLAHLQDGVMTKGTAVPYQIPPSPPNYYVNFLVEVL